MRLDRLPGWVIDNDASVRREVAPFVGMSMAERWSATRRCCRAAASMLRFHRGASDARAYRDPLPDSTTAALQRLRAAYREDAGDHR